MIETQDVSQASILHPCFTPNHFQYCILIEVNETSFYEHWVVFEKKIPCYMQAGQYLYMLNRCVFSIND